jgi:hypothetical protein
MATSKCPMCESACIIKLIATSDARWCEVDVCKMCGTMYPRNRDVVIAAPARPKRTKKKPAKKAKPAKAKARKTKKRK